MKSNKRCVWFMALTVLAGPLAPRGRSQQMTSFERERALQMLDDIAHDVQKHYYDPTFHGMDWNAKVLEEKQKIKLETSLNISLAHIAAALDSLNDSHTFFLPPRRPYHHDYGFQMEAIGDRCYITRVRPGSDAEAKGVKRGDEVLDIDGWHPEREILWKWTYRYNTLRPANGLRLALRDPEGHQRQVDVAAKFKETKRVTDLTLSNGGSDVWDEVRQQETQQHLMRARIEEMGDELMILKVPQFFFGQDEVDRWIDKARKHQALIVDLRGNPGGAVDTLKYLVGDIFEDEVKIADRVGRKDQKPEVAKSRGRAFTGKVAVLVDSKSASCAELFARIVQLQKRGVVMGDRSSGSVMEARRYSYHIGTDVVVFFGASITESDLVMSDGKSLEHTGVTPDEIVLPTAADLASGRDPVLSHAAVTLGVKLSPEEAGKLFPFEWRPE
ncbi:MAG TPA: S41 family peptidase [Terriglobia bacterium]|nr:S41 family peptidase [Terriglobia bacterium]